MKLEAATLVLIVICICLSFYLALLSFQTVDEALRKQLVTSAAFSLITGIVILVASTIHLGIKRAFSRMEDLLRSEDRIQRAKKIKKVTS